MPTLPFTALIEALIKKYFRDSKFEMHLLREPFRNELFKGAILREQY